MYKQNSSTVVCTMVKFIYDDSRSIRATKRRKTIFLLREYFSRPFYSFTFYTRWVSNFCSVTIGFNFQRSRREPMNFEYRAARVGAGYSLELFMRVKRNKATANGNLTLLWIPVHACCYAYMRRRSSVYHTHSYETKSLFWSARLCYKRYD